MAITEQQPILNPDKIPASKMKYVYIARVVLKLFSTVLEPVMLNLNIKKDHRTSDEQRRLMVTQQAIRQGVTLFTDSFAFVGGGFLGNHVFAKLPQAGPAIDRKFNQSPKTAALLKKTISKLPDPAIMGIISGLVGEEIIGNLLLRPFLMTKVTSWWDQRTENKKQPLPLSPATAPTSLPLPKAPTPQDYLNPQSLQYTKLQHSPSYRPDYSYPRIG